MTPTTPEKAILTQATSGHRSTLLSQALRVACKLAGVLIVARWVSPDEHGLYAMASSLVLLLALFRDGGLGTAAMRAHELSPSQLNTLFWAHAALGVFLSAATIAGAPLVAKFYGAAAVTPLLLWMSPAFVLIGAGGFARSQLARAARFPELNAVENLSAVLGTAAMIASAIAGAGAYAFVIFLLVSEAVATLAAWRVFEWRPHGAPEWQSLRPLLSTGADITLYQVLGYLLLQIDQIAVGRWFGALNVGLYSRANQLLAMPGIYVLTPLNQVALVTLSRLGQDSAHFVTHARTTATVIAHFILPLFAVCIALPAETVRLVLGPQWFEAAPLLRYLAIAAAASAVTSLAYAVNVAAGKTRRLVISTAAALPLVAAAVWIGRSHGCVGVARVVAAMNVLLIVPRTWWALREVPSGLRMFARALAGPFATSVIVGVALWASAYAAQSWDWQTRFISAAVVGVMAGAGFTMASPQLRREWLNAWSFLPLPKQLRRDEQ